MTLLQAIISGILQGITEFLPISSSGHLVILHHLFGIREPRAFFDLLLHVATLGAVIVYFYKDIIGLFRHQRRLGIMVLLGCVPAVIAGALFADTIEATFAKVRLVGLLLIVTGVWLMLASLISKVFFTMGEHRKLSIWQALLIGTAQAIALLPGVSRSGATISTGLMCGVDRELSFRYSFLMLVPLTILALLYKIKMAGVMAEGRAIYVACGMITAFIAGLVSLKVLSNTVRKGSLHLFGIYCVILALIVLAR